MYMYIAQLLLCGLCQVCGCGWAGGGLGVGWDVGGHVVNCSHSMISKLKYMYMYACTHVY